MTYVDRYRLDHIVHSHRAEIQGVAFDGDAGVHVWVKASPKPTQEALVLASVSHPAIPQLLHSAPCQEGWCMVRTYIPGTSLRTVLEQCPPSWELAVHILQQLCEVLLYLHAQGIIHGDLKPENIIMTPERDIVLIDYEHAILHPNQQECPFSFPYSSPEVQAEQTYSIQSDIYALGIITYELALGSLSHGRLKTALLPEPLRQLVEEMTHPIPARRPSLQTCFDDLQKSLHKERSSTQDSPALIQHWDNTPLSLHHYAWYNPQTPAVYHWIFPFQQISYILMAQSPLSGEAGAIAAQAFDHRLHTLSITQENIEHILERLPTGWTYSMACINTKNKTARWLCHNYGTIQLDGVVIEREGTYNTSCSIANKAVSLPWGKHQDKDLYAKALCVELSLQGIQAPYIFVFM